MAYDKDELLEAVNKLVLDPQASAMFLVLLEALPVACRLNLRFAGDNSVLNPLLELARDDRPAYDNVMRLVESKRQAQGLEPLDEARTLEDKYDKVAYMRDFMAQKREREKRAANIENMMRPEDSQLRGRSRMDFMQMQSKRWGKERDAAVSRARTLNGGPLTRAALNDVVKSFWAGVDRELDELEVLARAEQLKPPHLRGKGKK